ncbi:hypothetical protein OHA18_26240 [Kribbella sp. NBC_00709]|nr:hypothetical protein [Kribbella sp. NBC_00709]
MDSVLPRTGRVELLEAHDRIAPLRIVQHVDRTIVTVGVAKDRAPERKHGRDIDRPVLITTL